jgi:hypothetical protein
VFGIHVHTAEVAELTVAVFYGGLHAIGTMMGIATIILSLAMRRGNYGFFAGWIVMVGAKLCNGLPTFKQAAERNT